MEKALNDMIEEIADSLHRLEKALESIDKVLIEVKEF